MDIRKCTDWIGPSESGGFNLKQHSRQSVHIDYVKGMRVGTSIQVIPVPVTSWRHGVGCRRGLFGFDTASAISQRSVRFTRLYLPLSLILSDFASPISKPGPGKTHVFTACNRQSNSQRFFWKSSRARALDLSLVASVRKRM
jgi:hypothetical protein